MGAALHVSLDRDVPGVDAASVGGKALARTLERLDAMAEARGLTPLAAFISVSPEEAADVLGFEEGDAELADVPESQWRAPAEGLSTVRGLLGALREAPDALPRSAQVVVDLEACERVLTAAAAAGARFRLSVDV
jgi:hypothetical protein